MKYRFFVYLSALVVLFAFVFLSSAQQPGTPHLAKQDDATYLVVDNGASFRCSFSYWKSCIEIFHQEILIAKTSTRGC